MYIYMDTPPYMYIHIIYMYIQICVARSLHGLNMATHKAVPQNRANTALDVGQHTQNGTSVWLTCSARHGWHECSHVTAVTNAKADTVDVG